MTHAEVQHQVEEGYRMPAPPSCPHTLYLIIKALSHNVVSSTPHHRTHNVSDDRH
jgi:hypothetical protein